MSCAARARAPIRAGGRLCDVSSTGSFKPSLPSCPAAAARAPAAYAPAGASGRLLLREAPSPSRVVPGGGGRSSKQD
jgi:hypothetical protein